MQHDTSRFLQDVRLLCSVTDSPAAALDRRYLGMQPLCVTQMRCVALAQ
jgi:hypothetical protein